MTVLKLKISEHCESELMTTPVELYTHQDDKKKSEPSAHK
jgi:hypothetical protein